MLLPELPGHNRGQAAPNSITDLIGLKPFLHDLPELPELDNLFFSRRAHYRCTTGCHALWLIGDMVPCRREHVQKLVSGIKHLAATSAPTCAAKRKVDSNYCAPFAHNKTRLIPRDAFFTGKRSAVIAGASDSQLSSIVVCNK
ncbi:hypothetical protein M0R45_018840 [Rubus argutus]|uniref:Uncharacterized protein n=1 Tax=Rubus argutus TaxID=59490 RepID=A0AAW1X3U3_RUBAR